MTKRGLYIVIEGLDGSGKTTQFDRLLSAYGDKIIGVREPGGTPMAEHIRTLVKDKAIGRSPRTNAFLFSAARTEVIDTIIRPAIARGKHVLADRNWLSTLAYQSAEGLDTQAIEQLSKLATQEFFKPDLVILIDTDVATCRQRLHSRGGTAADYFDNLGDDYFTKVRRAYITHIKQLPASVIVDGNASIDAVSDNMLQATSQLLKP